MVEPTNPSPQHQFNNHWARLRQEVEETTDFKSRSLPLDDIKSIMEVDEDVDMISAETPALFVKACELFIYDLTMKAWANASKSKRESILKCEIASATTEAERFDFRSDFVPAEHAGSSRRFTDPTLDVPYCHMPVMPPHGPPYLALGMFTLHQNHHEPFPHQDD
ncbi:hypothetical protein Fmac_009191 [Flemingia macrophylla]|uniref:Core Histone H2A/H2B/H3 domain-containing protein n=1 Tax=Flemingia macrophylla TaxID=520843 RepID=A0ABD1N033_9FABA